MERDGIEGAYIDWADTLMKVWLNDGLVEDLILPSTGSGWLMGDGVFESMRTYDSKPFALQRHLDRLIKAAEKLEMAKPDIESIRTGVYQVIAHNVCRPYGRLRITALSDGNIVITHIPFTENNNSLKLTNAESVQLSTRMSAGLKTVSYAENSIALRRAQRQGFDDVLFVNEKGNIVESALANIIWFDGGSWWTPSLETGCLPGVTRALLIENFGVKEGLITPLALMEAQALAITSSVREIVSIERYESKLFGPSKELDELRDSFHAWILGNLEP